MKIQSRVEVKVPLGGERLGRYKDHRPTITISDGVSAIRGVGGYQPTKACPVDAVPNYWLAFGMDGRRFVLQLDQAELTTLRDDIDRLLKEAVLRRVK